MPGGNNDRSGRRTRRLLLFVGTAGSFYLVASYVLDRLREARLRALKERREKEVIRNHFSSLLSTISFTLYAHLPTLWPQLAAAYPVERTSQALQGLQTPSSIGSAQPTPDSSIILETGPSLPHGGGGDDTMRPGRSTIDELPSASSSSVAGETGESWASEFERHKPGDTGVTPELASPLVASSLVPGTEIEYASSTMSNSISLPPTDTSSPLASSPSDLSHSVHLHPSPPRDPARSNDHLALPQSAGIDLGRRSKKELWNDLKIQTLTRSLTTAYLIPLLYLLTASQLAVLARLRYLEDVKASLPSTSSPPKRASSDKQSSSSQADNTSPQKGWLDYLSLDAMGLSEFVEAHTRSMIPNPRNLLPEAINKYVPSIPTFGLFSSGSSSPTAKGEGASGMREQVTEVDKAEDERMYLAYSWWILNYGWKSISARVQNAVEGTFTRVGLKRELSLLDWEQLIREARARVEVEATDGLATLYSFAPHLLPPDPLPSDPGLDTCPLPISPLSSNPHLYSLLRETTTHISSPDGGFLIEKGVSAMVRGLLQNLQETAYSEDTSNQLQSRRLVDALPVIDRWSKGVWEGVPDNGVESLIGLPEFEGFVALVFGDWAPR